MNETEKKEFLGNLYDNTILKISSQEDLELVVHALSMIMASLMKVNCDRERYEEFSINFHRLTMYNLDMLNEKSKPTNR